MSLAKMTADAKYWAFISYSHADTKWAEWLHRALESYKIPRALTGKEVNGVVIPRRLLPIFRDRDELPGAHDLGGKLKQCLSDSRFLIVLCSPNSAKSRWVEEEISYFQSLGRHERILCVVIHGDPADSGENNCFPPSIGLKADGQRSDPLAVDLRPGHDTKTDALLRTVSGMLGLGFDDLKRREVQRQRMRRRLISLATVAGTLMLCGAYITVVDAGYEVPGSDRGRDYIDRYELSVLRPVESMDKIEQVAQANAQALVKRLDTEIRDGRWIKSYTNHPNGVKNGLDVWTAAQSISGVLNAPTVDLEVWQDATKTIESAFKDGLPLTVENVPYGWQATHTESTQAEPALWLTIAIAKAHKSAHADEATRRRLEGLLSYAQGVAVKYYGDQGDWYMVSGKNRPEIASNYTATLALLAMIETHAAQLPWEGSQERLKELTDATSTWLIKQLHMDAKQPGWHCNPTYKQITGNHDGLSLQTLYVLMRTHEEYGFTLTAEVKQLIPQYLMSLEKRDYAYPCDIYRPTYQYTDFVGVDRIVSPTIKFLWYPWAVASTAYWLQSSLAKEALPEQVVRMRRVLAHLVIGLSPEVEANIIQAKKSTYVAAEAMYGLACVQNPKD